MGGVQKSNKYRRFQKMEEDTQTSTVIIFCVISGKLIKRDIEGKYEKYLYEGDSKPTPSGYID